MYKLPVETIDGIVEETVYNPQLDKDIYRDYRYSDICSKRVYCKDHYEQVKYLNIPCAFDIETTNIIERGPDGKVTKATAFMYQWQFCIDDKVFFGRTWSEFLNFIDDLKYELQLHRKRRLVVYVHNLSFEFQFMRMFINVSEGFFKAERQPLKFLCNGAIEFRDSYTLSNMTLSKFCQNTEGVKHYKLVDQYDYSKIRTPETPLTEVEQAYCYNDVRGLCECIAAKMLEDNLANIPLTSTGYVRRDFRKAYGKNKKNRERFREIALTPEQYNICKLAFRGGDTHANVQLADQVLHDIQSFDLQSSYPAAEMLDLYPVGKFFNITPQEFFNRDTSEFAKLIHVRYKDIRYTGTCGNPYIPESRCVGITRKDSIIDNGRVLYAGLIDLWCTDIDFKIIEHDYDYQDIYINEVLGSRYGELPKEFKDCLMGFYRAKTELKGIEEKAYEYMKSKNKLNSSYGMMVTDIAKPEIEYINNDYVKKELILSEALDKYYKSRNSFLSYQQGLWVTANARLRLREMLWTVGPDNVYDDTDSIKCRHDHRSEFEAKNKEIIAKCEKLGAYAVDKKGIPRYMGTWEYEGTYQEFKTLGSKKYIYKEDNEYHSTIAGVNKKAGKKFFNTYGIDAFKIGTVIPNSGHLVAYYDDSPEHFIEVEGVKIKTAASVALVDDTYTIGVTGDYLDLLEKALENRAEVI